MHLVFQNDVIFQKLCDFIVGRSLSLLLSSLPSGGYFHFGFFEGRHVLFTQLLVTIEWALVCQQVIASHLQFLFGAENKTLKIGVIVPTLQHIVHRILGGALGGNDDLIEAVSARGERGTKISYHWIQLLPFVSQAWLRYRFAYRLKISTISLTNSVSHSFRYLNFGLRSVPKKVIAILSLSRFRTTFCLDYIMYIGNLYADIHNRRILPILPINLLQISLPHDAISLFEPILE